MLSLFLWCGVVWESDMFVTFYHPLHPSPAVFPFPNLTYQLCRPFFPICTCELTMLTWLLWVQDCVNAELIDIITSPALLLIEYCGIDIILCPTNMQYLTNIASFHFSLPLQVISPNIVTHSLTHTHTHTHTHIHTHTHTHTNIP